jgi:predicted Zn-dependent peptidase
MAADRSRLPDVGVDPAFTFPTIVRHVMPNGLAVRTVEHHSVPIVTYVLQIEGGSGADGSGQEGLAAMVADMADEGTGSMSAIDISDALSRIGADYDVDVGADATVFTLTTLTRFAERGASLLSDMTVRPSLHQEDFDRIRQLRLDRLKQLKDSAPATAERAFLRLIYGTHPYGHLAIGADPALRRLSLDDVRLFHSQCVQPTRATLVIVGALSHQQLLDAAKRFVEWPQAGVSVDGVVPASKVAPPAQPGARLALVPREGAAQSELRVGHLSALRTTPDYPSLLVMNAVLGGQFASRINLKLREEKAFTYGARTGFDWRRGLSPFVLQASVHTTATAESIADSFAEIEGIRGTRPPTSDELALAKASLTRGYPRNFETTQQVARSVAQLALYDLPDSYFADFVPKINAVSAADVTRAAATHLDTSKLATLIVGDQSAIADSLPALGLGEPHVLPLEL